MCISPTVVKKNYLGIDSYKGSDFTDQFTCGKCHECLARRRDSWSFRLYHQSLVSNSVHFITLTYAEAPISFNGVPTLCKRDLQLFFKRLRKRNKGPLKYYAVGEYGANYHRPHYHVILFGLDTSLAQRSLFLSERVWGLGHVDLAISNVRTINYTVGYVMKGAWQPMDEFDDRAPEFSCMSKNLGLSYLDEKTWDYHLDRMINYVRMPNGTLSALPRYYRDRIFSKEERKELNEEAKMIRDTNWTEWCNHIANEPRIKNDAIRRHQKKLILNRCKL